MKSSLRICIVTADIVGPIRNGGIGTAYGSLAHALSAAGHKVTVLYTHGSYCENETVAHWRRVYRRAGIEFVPVPPTRVLGHTAVRMAHAVYEWLKTRRFDIVHCHEWRGVGFFAALGKRQGLCLENTVLCVGAHSPTLWCLEGLNELADAEALEVDFMERQSVALADVLWTPSLHMRDWMRREGWTLPDRVLHEQCLLGAVEPSRAGGAEPGSELVFFGRLEIRKGLDLFCDALDRLEARGLRPRFVRFLGKSAHVHGIPSEEYLRKRGVKWRFPWQIVTTCDRHGAMAHLRGPNRVAVLPSRLDNLPYTVLECLGSGIPFVASNIGGIPEMIRPADRDRVLFDLTATSLADRLAEVLKDGLSPVPLRVSAEQTLAHWLSWHERIVADRITPPAEPRLVEPAKGARSAPDAVARTTSDPSAPLVSVCVTHRNRPGFVNAALDSLRAQDYPHLEVILVDDGSDQPEAKANLQALEAEFRSRQWQIVLQANRYVGAARNTGIAAARGEYILLMDDDNLAMPNEVSTFVRAAQHSDADVLTCLMYLFQSRRPAPARLPRAIWPFLGGALAPGLLRNVFGDANAFFHRSVFERIGGFSEDFGISGEDWELLGRAVIAGLRVEVVPEPLVRYRQSPNSMLHTTSHHANHMRALRPYFQGLPAHLRPLVHLSQRERIVERGVTTPPPANLNHVRRAVVFGSGEGGRLALGLAARCGWQVPWIVDNNPAVWNKKAHGLPVREPKTLKQRSVDLVIVASLAGKPAISTQLEKMGFAPGKEFVHFLDPVKVNGTTLQLSLP